MNKIPQFNCPKSIFTGEDSLELMETIPFSKCFIITDKNLVKLGVVKILTDFLDNLEKPWNIFDEVEPDPLESTILRATEQCNGYAPDLIIGIGGGSSLDTAKAVWFLYEHAEDGLVIDDLNPFQEMHMGVKAKCVAISTTSGTGAEVTWAAIITRVDEEGNHSKLEQSHADLVPTYAVVDPIFTKGLPPKLTAATGFDVLAHCCEGLISEWRNDLAEACSLHALDLVKDYLLRAYEDGSDMEAREKMGNAATLAGLGFGNSQVIMGHALAHSLGAIYHLPHGLTVGMMLPYTLEYSMRNTEDDMVVRVIGKAAKKLGLCEWSEDDTVATQKLIDWLKDLQKKVDLPSSLSAAGITRAQFDEKLDDIIQLANESASIAMSPREPADEDLSKLLNYIFDGKSIDF